MGEGNGCAYKFSIFKDGDAGYVFGFLYGCWVLELLTLGKATELHWMISIFYRQDH